MNFIHNELPVSDRQLFFQEDEAKTFLSSDTMINIVMQVTNITRKGARAAGWDRLIPEGFMQHKIGKKMFWTLNKWDGCNDAD